MKVLIRELKAGRKSFAIWTLSILGFVAICVFMFPEMKTSMDTVSAVFSSMGAFSSAFGMDRLGMGSLIGFYSVECGTILGLGSALFAAMAGSAIVGKEEKERTAEFLFSHPVSRESVLLSKYLALQIEILVLHILGLLCTVLSIIAVGEEVPWSDLILLHTSYYIMTMCIGSVCFALSATKSLSGIGAGMGLVLVMYFMNLTANISDKTGALKYLTPFSFTNGADIVLDGALDWGLIMLWIMISFAAVVTGIVYYTRRDLRS
ncbi:MAG: ABC transporter permease subunit [Candidatus Ornithospirochaeta sp.]